MGVATFGGIVLIGVSASLVGTGGAVEATALQDEVSASHLLTAGLTDSLPMSVAVRVRRQHPIAWAGPTEAEPGWNAWHG